MHTHSGLCMLEPGKEGQAERWPVGQRPHTDFARTEFYRV